MTVSLTDKYRPTSLKEVLGQERVIKSLEKVLNDKRAKAFIFSGPSGCGKTTIARILAGRFAAGGAAVTNVIERDAAFASGADDVRALCDSLAYRALGANPIKTVILDECHKLSNTAWNILLKPIEEPPEHVYWTLCTTDPGKIPQTIKTRCVSYALQAVKEQEILELLCKVADDEGFTTPDEVIEAIAEGAGGSPRLALNLLEACLNCTTAAEARIQMRVAEHSKEAIDLCRFIGSDRGNWADAAKLIKALAEIESEGVRISVVNYLTAMLLNTKDTNRALTLLMKIEAFSTPFNQTDKQAPLVLAVATAMRIGE